MLPHPARSPELAHRAPPADQWPPAWASAWGDDRYGLWAELELEDRRLSDGLELSGSSGKVVQRFRWIEPGSFLMGSPISEPERQRFEGPQHSVTLTQGFWLADTACTQALWLVVVGGRNPSGFTGDLQLPVEQVSWDDVTRRFLPELQALLPADAVATLPTEAQWEYACRAGTTTPFSWGDTIHSGLVNYDGNHPYNGGPKGEYRERTVPVLTLPANNWGLHQMHGNVWEWCWDERRDYAESAMVDPTGAIGDGQRVLRGGSWHFLARIARSADRIISFRASRSNYFGFRVALRFK
jgi:formylglycine-generating enzyme required for sulfatase activity